VSAKVETVVGVDAAATSGEASEGTAASGAETPTKQGVKPRIVALLGLATLALGMTTLGRATYFAATDGWMAPITLSPDNDQVLQITVKLNEQQVQREKLRSDVERIDVDLRGVDAAMARLHALEENGQNSLRWTAYATKAQWDAVGARMHSLDEQKKLLDEMVARQQKIADNARRNAEAGLTSRQELQREAQLLDQLELGRVQNMRDMADSRVQNVQFGAMSSVINGAMKVGTPVGQNGLMPEIAAGQEREARLVIEIARLEAEKRALVSQKAISVETLTRMDDLLKQLKSRPQYRAVAANTDVAFIPYTQLADVSEGSQLMSCKWVLFRCEVVGRVAEILPGEVVAQDPWAQIARGQYAILDLSDREAVKEKVLRARRKTTSR